jgi:hypothetical protein
MIHPTNFLLLQISNWKQRHKHHHRFLLLVVSSNQQHRFKRRRRRRRRRLARQIALQNPRGCRKNSGPETLITMNP